MTYPCLACSLTSESFAKMKDNTSIWVVMLRTAQVNEYL